MRVIPPVRETRYNNIQCYCHFIKDVNTLFKSYCKFFFFQVNITCVCAVFFRFFKVNLLLCCDNSERMFIFVSCSYFMWILGRLAVEANVDL